MYDRFNRRIDYLRISVTDRCNLRCHYCRPPGDVVYKAHEDILTFEEIEAIAREAVGLGVKKIRLTGGEPLIRSGCIDLVAKLGTIEGLEELSMTTNGTRLRTMADRLKRAGLTRVNISLDTLDPERYRELTGGGRIDRVLWGIDAAVRAGLTPIKINMVILEDTSEEDIRAMKEYCDERGLKLQKIMRFSLLDRDDLSSRIPTERPPRCHNCNRLRLTSDGYIKPCLFSEDEIGVDIADIKGSILRAVASKPRNGRSCHSRPMQAIGG